MELALGPLKIQTECWDQAFHSFGSAAIFGKRAKPLRRKLRILTFLGIVVPASVGVLVMSFGYNFEHKEIVIWIASFLGFIQLILSIWSLVAKWDDAFAYSLESISANNRLSSLFQALAKNPPSDTNEMRTRYELLQAEYLNRESQDNQQLIKEKEKRFGMRVALRQFQRACVGCKQIPTSLKSTSCNVCGQF